MDDPVHNRRFTSRSLEGKGSRQHLVEHNSGRENIGSAVEWLTLELLGRHVMQTAHHFRSAHAGIANAGNAEVNDFDVAVFQQHYVSRLDVTMDNAAIMRVVQSVADIHADAEFGGKAERAPG